ncbi:MAG TPA: hypothetical protein VGG30_05565, partial [Pirellulales bacterium]
MIVLPRHSPLRVVAVLLALAAWGVFSAAASGQTARPAALSVPLQAFARECETLRYGTILKLEESLRGLKSGQLVTPDKAGTIRQTEADLKALRTRERVIVPALHFPPRAGQIGRLPGGSVYVEQVLGPNEALVRCSFNMTVVVTRNKQSVSEVVHQRPLFKIHGVPTADWQASTDAELLGAFEIAGSERYQTVDGHSATVQVLKPFD